MRKIIFILIFIPIVSFSQIFEKQHQQLILRSATLINSTGAPPLGPVDIVIENNIITKIQNVGYPGVPINNSRRPKLTNGGVEIDCEGSYILPGFIDTHGHIGGRSQGANPEYVFKLWMAHGITSIREPGGSLSKALKLELKNSSKKNEIIAPRIFSFSTFNSRVKSPDEAREWVRNNAKEGSDGIKFFGAPPEIMEAAIKENKKIGLRSTAHHAQLNVVKWNVLNSARAGLTSMEHWYGLPEALFNNRIIQNYPPNYNYQNEQHRFEEAGKLWAQAAEPFSDHWNNVMNELISLDFTISPTLNIYEASRDLHRARRAEWHDDYTLPSLWGFYAPSRISHGSYWHYWGTEQEVAWKENYRLWMIFLNEFKNRGGRVTVGSDSGFIYQLYGFAYVRELELLREAGFHPLEVIQSATLNGAETLGIEKFTGSVEVGKFADLIVIDENPLENLKVLYGTGAIKLDDDNNVTRVGGVKYTIKDGIVYDAKKLLLEVKNMVDLAKKEAGYKIKQPGIE
tara:strand:+ start:141 stop:1679 length:1539 start_codon:yes stop_codon:yes gene_type:complete